LIAPSLNGGELLVDVDIERRRNFQFTVVKLWDDAIMGGFCLG
jgi:hypothetical protein